MNLPFTSEQFFALFERYNVAVWPAQLVLNLMAVLVLVLIHRGRPSAGRWIAAALSLLWAWMAVAYHFAYFSTINPAAWAFGAMSLLGAIALAWVGVVQGRLAFARRGGLREALGGALVVFALLAYPSLGWLLGHRYPAVPTFGLPCPTTIFTIGVLLFATGPVPRPVLVVPLLWTAVGATAAFTLGVYQDLGLLVAGAVGLVALTRVGSFGDGADGAVATR